MSGCSGGTPAQGSVPPGPYADSSRTAEEHMQRFTAHLAARPRALTGGARSPEQLVTQFVRAVEQRDTTALMRTHLSRAEFAYLYYPVHPQAQPPYSLPPDLMWLMIEMQSGKGLVGALSQLGGRQFQVESVHCPQVSSFGDGRLHSACVGTLRHNGGGASETTLALGPVFERDGQFKFVSFGVGD